MGVDERWRQIERRVNEELAKLSPLANRGEIDAVLERMLPDGYVTMDVQTVGGPPQIVITRCP